MALVWLVYERDGKRVVVIERASSIVHARLQASISHDMDGGFVEAHQLPKDAAVAPEMIGKVLSATQAGRVLKGLASKRGK